MWNSKPKRHDCDCRRRTHGNPKVPTGICYGSKYRAAAVQRIAGKRMVRAWLVAARPGALDYLAD